MIYDKGEVIDYIWQYSKYYGNLLISCEELSKEKNLNGHASLIYLFNILENIIKSQIHDYDASFVKAIDKLKSKNYINNIECEFLNNKDNGIRKIRNLLAHANLSKYNIIFLSEDKELLYPLTENETGIKFYDLISKIIFNLMLKIISSNLIIPISVNIDKEIEKFNITIKEITAEQLLEYKGIDYKTLKGWNEMPEIEKYRMAENTSDVNHYVQLFQMMGLKK
jgi:hypothetical protein